MNIPGKVKALSLAVLMGLSGSAWAGLGNVKIYSHLGEPFYAVIPLTGQTAKDATDPLLSTSDEMAKLSIQGSSSGNALNFRIVRKNKQTYVQVKSNSPINEPILTFGVRVSSASGVVTRQYSAMLDPRNYNPPQGSNIGGGNTVIKNPQKESSTEPRTSSGRTVYVQSGDTLTAIASRFKPARMSLANTKRAIFLANRKAFVNGNPARIKKGATIQVPTAARMRALLAADRREAKPRPVTGTTSSTTNSQPTTTTAANPPVTNINDTKELAQLKAQLKQANDRIKKLEDELKQAKANAKLADDKAIAAANGAEKAKLEAIAKAKKEADEIKAKKEADDKAARAQKEADDAKAKKEADDAAQARIEIEKEQAREKAEREAAEQAAAEASANETDTVLLPIEDDVSGVPAVESEEASAVTEEETSAVVAVEEPPVSPPLVIIDDEPPEPEETGFIESLLADPMPLLAGGGGLLLIIGLLIFMKKRRGKAKVNNEDDGYSDDETFFSMGSMEETNSTGFPAQSSAPQKPAQNMAPVVTPKQASASASVQAPVVNVGGESKAASTFMSDFTRMSAAIDSVEIDPLSEAEVYIAYGRTDEAEEILKDALAKDPAQHEVRKKLLEIYASRQEVAPFASMAKELYDAFDGRGALWQEVATMGRQLDPSNPLYADGSAPAVAPSAPGSSASVDFPSTQPGNALVFDEPIATPDNSSAQDDSFLMDFSASDLDFPDASGSVDFGKDDTGLQTEPAKGSSDLGMQDLEFDLDAVLNDAKESGALNDTVSEVESLDFGSTDFGATDFGSADFGDSLSLTDGALSNDPASAKLELARVYLDMGDVDGAKEALTELLEEAENPVLRTEAEEMLRKITS